MESGEGLVVELGQTHLMGDLVFGFVLNLICSRNLRSQAARRRRGTGGLRRRRDGGAARKADGGRLPDERRTVSGLKSKKIKVRKKKKVREKQEKVLWWGSSVPEVVRLVGGKWTSSGHE